MNTALVNATDNKMAMNAPTIGGSLRKNIIGLCFLCLAAYCSANKLVNDGASSYAGNIFYRRIGRIATKILFVRWLPNIL